MHHLLYTAPAALLATAASDHDRAASNRTVLSVLYCELLLQVVPMSGTVLPMGQQVVLVEFLSQSLQVYNEHQLALDITTVGEGLHKLPIKAECVVPMVTPNTELLDFEQCYLR